MTTARTVTQARTVLIMFCGWIKNVLETTSFALSPKLEHWIWLSLQPITDALLNYYSHYPQDQRYLLRVLMPGAGLGRLVYDIAKLGFSAQGCEFSYQMLVASNYILNYAPGKEALAIHPWVLSSSNVWDAQSQQLKQVRCRPHLFSVLFPALLEEVETKTPSIVCTGPCLIWDFTTLLCEGMIDIRSPFKDCMYG